MQPHCHAPTPHFPHTWLTCSPTLALPKRQRRVVSCLASPPHAATIRPRHTPLAALPYTRTRGSETRTGRYEKVDAETENGSRAGEVGVALTNHIFRDRMASGRPNMCTSGCPRLLHAHAYTGFARTGSSPASFCFHAALFPALFFFHVHTSGDHRRTWGLLALASRVYSWNTCNIHSLQHTSETNKTFEYTLQYMCIATTAYATSK
jgi:hypothetical protein